MAITDYYQRLAAEVFERWDGESTADLIVALLDRFNESPFKVLGETLTKLHQLNIKRTLRDLAP